MDLADVIIKSCKDRAKAISEMPLELQLAFIDTETEICKSKNLSTKELKRMRKMIKKTT